MTNNEIKVFEAIKNVYPRPATRGELVIVTGIPDRNVRKNVQKLRHRDIWIISSAARPGYWLTEDPREWDAFVDNWNLGNKYNMLKKTKVNYSQEELSELMEEFQNDHTER